MLIGARDKNGRPSVWKNEIVLRGSMWCSKDGIGVSGLVHVDDDAEPFCQNIPNGESRVIALEKSVIVHVQPKKTPYEELVEAADFVITAIANIGHDDIEFTSWPVNGAKLKSLKRALARVRQEGGA